jgi:excisionase family DNA binding protein
MKKSYLTSNEVATLLRVTPVTVRQWSQKGMLAAEYTPGGHRRFLIHEIERFAARHGISLAGISSRRLDVLIIDSDEAVCANLVEKLDALAAAKGREINVETATNCFEAGAKTFSFRPQYILLDLDMNGVDTCDACNVLRTISARHDTRVIVMSADASNDASLLEDSGFNADSYSIKPVQRDSLISFLGLNEAAPQEVY